MASFALFNIFGILLACVSFVLQTSRVSAIRGNLPGGVANSTVRRHPIQHRFLHSAGQQTHVMKLAGYLFFGTIVGVEKHIRDMLQEKFQLHPIRFLVLDLYNVDGVDFSAAEAFSRINRILKVKGVELVICGIKMNGEVGTSLCNVGLFNEDDGALYCESLNSALEYCENELLKAFYQQQMSDPERESAPSFLEIPKRKQSFSQESIYSSPRRNHLHQVATNTLENSTPPTKWQNHNQPLQLILQTFSSLSTQPESFWRRLAPFFTRRAFPANSTLYHRGDPATGFYLLETGILKADYDLQQGQYTELIVERTTCGELPFFSGTERTSTTTAERDCVTWLLDEGSWASVQREEPEVAQELLKISLKLTSERMDAITSYMLLTSG
ncbi:sulfate transporter [Physcia stellaris]|nr:sulfate transporter [Physcia stellaris]